MEEIAIPSKELASRNGGVGIVGPLTAYHFRIRPAELGR